MMKEMNFEPLRRRLGALALAIAAAFALGNHGSSGAALEQPAVAVVEQRMLIPGGKAVGIAIETEGVILVGTSDLGTVKSPARQAGLKPGDVITKVNDTAVNSAEDLAAILKAGEGAAVTAMRDGEEKKFEIIPAEDPRDGLPKIGAWVRSSTAGVGTLTYIDPRTGEYAALGHAISDVDTGVLLPVADGGLYESEIVRVNKGEKGRPGELVGDFLSDEQQLGSVSENSDTGVYGVYTAADTSDLLYPGGLPVGSREQMHTGPAQIIAEVDNQVRAYDVEIEHIEPDGARELRSIVVHVTDPDLIGRTGGIVQGMSGSPIIQDGMIVGAVTHVFVNDPTRGYGIGIEAMLEAA